MRIIPEIVEQHAEEAAFLWLFRDQATRAPHYSLDDLAELDERVEAHLDGLRIAGEPGWELCREALDFQEAGEVFAAAVLAFESGERDRIDTVLETGVGEPELERGLISALGWLAPERARQPIEDLLAAEDPPRRRIGVAASAARREEPRFDLGAALVSEEPRLRASALRAAGELGRASLRHQVLRGLDDDDDACRYFAARSATLLNDRPAAAAILRETAEAAGPRAAEACAMAVRSMPLSDAGIWLRKLAAVPATRRLAIQGAGAAGDPALVPWLIQAMEDPELARIAGEALTWITGIDLAGQELEGEPPEGFEAGPSEEPEDDNVEMDADEDLPWPATEAVAEWWLRERRRFTEGIRHLLGEPLGPEVARRVLRVGFQRQRAAAAVELAMTAPEGGFFEVRAPGARQQRWLQNGGGA